LAGGPGGSDPWPEAYRFGIYLAGTIQFLLLICLVGDQIPERHGRGAAFTQRNTILEIFGEFGEWDAEHWIALQEQLTGSWTKKLLKPLF